MDFYKDKATIMRLDEVRELLLNLSKITSSTSSSSSTTLTELKQQLNSKVSELKTSLIGDNEESSNPTSLEDRLKVKLTEIYNSILQNLNDIKTNQTSIESLQTTLQTNQSQTNEKVDLTATKVQAQEIINAIDEINVLLTSSSSAGLTDAQSQTLNQIHANTVALLDSVGLSENASTILTKLGNIEQNTLNIVQKLELPNSQFQDTEPYDPPPDSVYKTRDTYKSPFIYNINAPKLLDAEYFTINNNVNAMCKVEFDIVSTSAISDVKASLLLSGNEVLYNETIEIVEGTSHYCINGIFVTNRTDYNLRLQFNNFETASFTVKNLTYEVVGNNANFIDYKHSFYPFNVNYDYYIFKDIDGAVSYITTNAQDVNLGQNYTNLTSGTNYLFYPTVLSINENTSNSTSVFKSLKVLRQDITTKEVQNLNQNGELVGGADSVSSKGARVVCPLPSNSASINNYVLRYNPNLKKLFNCYYNTDFNGVSVDSTGIDLSEIDEIVCISPCKLSLTYKQFGLINPYVIVTTKKGCNYVCSAFTLSSLKNLQTLTSSNGGENVDNSTSETSEGGEESNNQIAVQTATNVGYGNLGYGTRVTFGEIDNYQGNNVSTRITRTYRAFMYVYDHWKVIYFSLGANSFEILGTKTISGEYDELHPGFNGDYFGVKDGQIIKLTDGDVSKVDLTTSA